MLVFSRRTDQSFIIGNGVNKITVKVLGVQGGNVKLGIDAPREIAVHREEIYRRILAEANEQEDTSRE